MNITANALTQEHYEQVYKPLIEGKVDPKKIKAIEEANNAVGKMIGLSKLTLEAIALSKDRPADVRKAIPFLA